MILDKVLLSISWENYNKIKAIRYTESVEDLKRIWNSKGRKIIMDKDTIKTFDMIEKGEGLSEAIPVPEIVAYITKDGKRLSSSKVRYPNVKDPKKLFTTPMKELNSSDVDYLNIPVSDEVYERVIKTKRCITIQNDRGMIVNMPVRVTVLAPDFKFARKYVSDVEHISQYLELARVELTPAKVDDKIVEVTDEDMERFETTDKALIVLYKLILDKEV